MKYLIIFFSCFSFLFAEGEGIVEKFTNPKLCGDCHKEQLTMWQTSVHAKSHEDKNELYRLSVEMVAKQTFRPYETVLVECGQCHNPRLEVKSVNEDFMIAKNFGISTNQTKEVKDAISAKHIKNGIGCYVCHNVDSIEQKKTNKDAGYKLINWVKDETIVGPFVDENNRAKDFHKSSQRPFFKETDELCLICHQGEANSNPLSVYNTGNEHKNSEDTTRCAYCHMSPEYNTIISPNAFSELAVKRTARSHTFSSVRNNRNLLKNAIDVRFELDDNIGYVIFENKISHKLPSGFSGRSMIADIYYMQNEKIIKTNTVEFKAQYTDKKNKPSLSYIATNLVKDDRLDAFEIRKVGNQMPKGVNKVKVNVYYYLISPELQDIIGVKDKEFTDRYGVGEFIFEIK